MTDKHKKQTLETEFGQRVVVERERLDKVLTREAADRLTDIGKRLQDVEKGLKVYEYVGSAAVHIYYCKALGRVDFVAQLPLGNASIEMANKAIRALESDTEQLYTGKRRTKRSGW